MEAMTATNNLPHVCAQLGMQEVWEVVNNTGEPHNFHIHQNKFRLAQQNDPGVPHNLVSFQDPANLIAQYEPEAQNNVSTEKVDVWHDVLPPPPYGGRIFITVSFMSKQQVGTFVYHCHILSHEDA
ncbi:MAG: multicopper oxidase domain-containing protein [Janthinobacterium lividum]